MLPVGGDRRAPRVAVARCAACRALVLVRLRWWLAAFGRSHQPWTCPYCGQRRGFVAGQAHR